MFQIGWLVKKVHTYRLSNGLNVLVYSDKYAPKVSAQIWYNVGSKDEKTGQKGLAHFLEHMIFKGTERLSESDINLITHKLSGYTNAFTSYDYTGYLFDFPTAHWKMAFDLFADNMVNCTFKKDFLNAELKAVVQELKMYKDDYITTLSEQMITAIFPEHPYHYPIIGYKQDLCAITQENLHAFYKKYYAPNNATIVIVGNIDPEEVNAQAEKYFSHIPSNEQLKKEVFSIYDDIKRTSVTLYREVEQPIIMCAWKIPGLRKGLHYYFDILKWLLAKGKGSRLYQHFVENLKLATDVDCFMEDLFDCSLFFIQIYPKNTEDVEAIVLEMERAMRDLVSDTYTQRELERAMKQVQISMTALFEQSDELAYAIGQSWLATHNAQYVMQYAHHTYAETESKIKDSLPLFSAQRMHTGFILPASEQERLQLLEAQKISDAWDEKIIAKKERSVSVEEGAYVHKVAAQEPAQTVMPTYTQQQKNNGIMLSHMHSDRVDKIDIQLMLHAREPYDPPHLSGLANMVYQLLQEGTEKYPGVAFIQELESYGMSVHVIPGSITLCVLKDDIEKGFELLAQMILHPEFSKNAIEKVRTQLFSELSEFWDTPSDFIACLVQQRIYKDHPFQNYYLGSREDVARARRDDIVSWWQSYGSPDKGYMAVVGPVSFEQIDALYKKHFGSWKRMTVQDLTYPQLPLLKKETVQYPINRDQIVLCFAGISVRRTDSEYDALVLFDQILTGGAQGSMSSRLFQLREQTGLFYTIGGSMVRGATHEPGMCVIKTIVSADALEQVKKMIHGVLHEAPRTIQKEELAQAKHAVIHSMAYMFSSHDAACRSLIFLAKYGFDESYISDRIKVINNITIDEVASAAQKILQPDRLITIEVGRL